MSAPVANLLGDVLIKVFHASTKPKKVAYGARSYNFFYVVHLLILRTTWYICTYVCTTRSTIEDDEGDTLPCPLKLQAFSDHLDFSTSPTTVTSLKALIVPSAARYSRIKSSTSPYSPARLPPFYLSGRSAACRCWDHASLQSTTLSSQK